MKRSSVGFVVASLLTSGCFVSESDCVQNGVSVTPCVINARAGQTIVLTAEVLGAPDEPVNWILPPAAPTAFAWPPLFTSNQITLVSTTNVPGVYPVQATSQTNELVYGGSAVGISSASFSSQAPPFVIFGGDFPVGSKYAATAIGGNVYYVAYAASAAFLAGEASLGPGVTNFFVRQYDLATNQLLREVGAQFAGFMGTGSSLIIPNVAADCSGNGYWVDHLASGQNYALRRLRADGTGPDEQPLGPFNFNTFRFQTLTVACDGSIYFVATPFSGQGSTLFRIASFGQAPVVVTVDPTVQTDSIDTMAVDSAGRLLIGEGISDGGAGLRRLTIDAAAPGGPTATLDPSFDDGGQGDPVFDVTTDASGVVYLATSGSTTPVLRARNENGTFIYDIGTYEFSCPTGCPVGCGADVPFTNILSVAASPAGALRVVDDVLTDTLPTECQESVRFVLLDPQ